MYEKLHARIAEWLLVRKTATLGDLVDEATFAEMCKCTPRTLRCWRSDGASFGLTVPEPIFRPDGKKPIWLRQEAEQFARKLRAARNARK